MVRGKEGGEDKPSILEMKLASTLSSCPFCNPKNKSKKEETISIIIIFFFYKTKNKKQTFQNFL